MKEFYNNGYGVSVISNEFSYGGRQGLFELAILIGDEDYSDISYDTHITNDVLGYLTHVDVENIIKQVKDLPMTLNAISKNRNNKINFLNDSGKS